MSGPVGPSQPDERRGASSEDQPVAGEQSPAGTEAPGANSPEAGGEPSQSGSEHTPKHSGDQTQQLPWQQQPGAEPTQAYPSAQQPYPGVEHPQAQQQYPGQPQYPAQQYPGQQYPGQPAGDQQQWSQQAWGAQQPGAQQQTGQPQTGAQPQFQAYNAQQQQQQYPGQPGQFQQGGYPQPGQPQWGAPVSGQPGGGSSKAPLWIALGIGAIVVLGVIAAIAGMAFLSSDTLDRASAERGVEQVLTGSYGIKDISDVTCPADQKVEKGGSFTCDLTVDGEPQQVTVTFTDDSGTYEVSRPSAK